MYLCCLCVCVCVCLSTSDSPSLATLHTVHFFSLSPGGEALPISMGRGKLTNAHSGATMELQNRQAHQNSFDSRNLIMTVMTLTHHPKLHIRHPKLHIDHQLIGAHEASAMLSQASPALLERAICLTASSLLRQPATRKGDRRCFLFLAVYLEKTTGY